MLLNISPHSSQTLQEQIVSQIRARILSGELVPDQPLASIRSLSQSLKVGINTVQRAYEHLLRDELIYARAGKGYFVAPLDDTEKYRFAKLRFQNLLREHVKDARREGLNREDLEQIFLTLLDEACDGK